MVEAHAGLPVTRLPGIVGYAPRGRTAKPVWKAEPVAGDKSRAAPAPSAFERMIQGLGLGGGGSSGNSGSNTGNSGSSSDYNFPGDNQ